MRNDRRPALLLLSGRMLFGRSSATRRARCTHMLRRTACTVHAERHPPEGLPTTVPRFGAVWRVVGPRRVSSRGLFCVVSSVIDGSRLELRLSGLLSYKSNWSPKAGTKLKDIRLISCDLHKPFTPNNANWLNELWFVNTRAMFKMLHIWERAF